MTSIDVSKIKPGDTVTVYRSSRAGWRPSEYVTGVVADGKWSPSGLSIYGSEGEATHVVNDVLRRIVSHTPAPTWAMNWYTSGTNHFGEQTVPSRMRNESGTEGTASGDFDCCAKTEPEWRSALVIRNDRGYYYGKTLGGWQLLSWRAINIKAPDDELGDVTVVIDADGRNVEAEQQREAHQYSIRLHRGDREDLKAKLDAAEQSLAEAVRGRETALRDLRKAEQRDEKAEEVHDRHFEQWRDSYEELRTDYNRAKLAYKSARQRAVEWKGTAEAVGDQLHRKIKKLKKQRDKARNANDARAADELESLADWFFDRLPDGTGNGRAYNSYTVARIARDRAAKLRGEK